MLLDLAMPNLTGALLLLARLAFMTCSKLSSRSPPHLDDDDDVADDHDDNDDDIDDDDDDEDDHGDDKR